MTDNAENSNKKAEEAAERSNFLGSNSGPVQLKLQQQGREHVIC